MGARDIELDLDEGNRDSGDADASEVRTVRVTAWHPSFMPAKVPDAPAARTEVGRRYLDNLKSQVRQQSAASEKRPPMFLTCWHDTPELYRRMVVHAAGLTRDVVEKMDRDLTEAEKTMLRSAISDLRMVLSALVSL